MMGVSCIHVIVAELVMALRSRLRSGARRRHHAGKLGDQEQGDQQTGKPGYGPEPIHLVACFCKKAFVFWSHGALPSMPLSLCGGPATHRPGARPWPARSDIANAMNRAAIAGARPRNQVKNAGRAMTQRQATAARSSKSGFDRRSSRSVRQKAAPPLRKNDCSGLVTTR
jgi:hypothetical protein